ncbi:MAG TPA: hypothetical protein ENJ31_01595 [Anaerolineae bacterium]|nr:hypothetical protein [Anaerolineae bacterium]
MAQDISGTSLLSNAQATSARVCFRGRFDWGDAGFGSLASWSDESAYIRSASGEMRAARKGLSALGAVSAVARVALFNPEETAPNSGLRFSPSNANGSLYSQIGQGKIHMKRAILEAGFYAGATPEYARQITGYIVDVIEQSENQAISFEIRDRAAVAALSRASTGLYEGVDARTYLTALAALLDRDPPGSGERDFDLGIALEPFAWLDDEEIWREMNQIAEAHGGRIWWDRAGVLRFEDLSHWVRPHADSWQDPTTSQFTFTVSDFESCNPRYNPDDVINHVIVEAVPRYISILQVIYSASETYIVPPGGSIEVEAVHRWPVRNVAAPVAGTDYVAVTAGGETITSDLSVSVSSLAGRSTITLSNANADYAAHLYTLQLRGFPLLSSEPITVEVEDSASITQYGRRTKRIRNPYIQERRHAEALADFMLARFRNPPLTISLAGVPGVPWLEPGDRVTVQEADLGISDDFFITAIKWEFADGGLEQSLDLVRCADLYPYSDYFIIGTSKFGGAGTTGAGRLTW